MRRPTEAESHRARARLIDGEYPEGMRARCALCGAVALVAAGEMIEVSNRSDEPSRVFLCPECSIRRRAAA